MWVSIFFKTKREPNTQVNKPCPSIELFIMKNNKQIPSPAYEGSARSPIKEFRRNFLNAGVGVYRYSFAEWGTPKRSEFPLVLFETTPRNDTYPQTKGSVSVVPCEFQSANAGRPNHVALCPKFVHIHQYPLGGEPQRLAVVPAVLERVGIQENKGRTNTGCGRPTFRGYPPTPFSKVEAHGNGLSCSVS